MCRVEVIKDFATPEECAALNGWVGLAVQNKWLDEGLAKNRLTSRMCGDRFENPQVALDLYKRVEEYWGLEDAQKPTTHGKDGIVVTSTMTGGSVFEHTDGSLHKTLQVLRCNLLSQEADNGCDMYINDQLVDVAQGDVVCYLVTAYKHRVTENLGSAPRNLWMFGFFVPFYDWENGFIGLKEKV